MATREGDVCREVGHSQDAGHPNRLTRASARRLSPPKTLRLTFVPNRGEQDDARRSESPMKEDTRE